MDTIRGVDGVASADGMVFADGARLIGANGKVVTLGRAAAVRGRLAVAGRPAELREGRGPTADDEIAINAGLAKAGGVKVGDKVGVLTLEPRKDFTIVGVFGYAGGRDSQGGSQVIAFTRPVAQQLMLGQTGVYSAVDVKADSGVTDDALRDRVAANARQRVHGEDRQAAGRRERRPGSARRCRSSTTS